MRDVSHEIRWGEACCRRLEDCFWQKKKKKDRLFAFSGEGSQEVYQDKTAGRWRKQSGEHTIHERERRVVKSGWVSKEVQKCVLRTWVKKPRSFSKSKARIVVELHSYGQRTCEGRKRHAQSNELHAVFPRGRFGGGDNQKV